MAEKPTYEELEQRIKELEKVSIKFNLIEKKLYDKDKHLQSILESANGFAIYRLVVDKENPYRLRTTFVSPSIRDVLGCKPEEFSSTTFFSNIHPDDLERFEQANQQAFETNRFDEICQFYNSVKKQWIWIHAISTGVFNDEGHISYVNGIFIDITAQKQSEELLSRSEENLKSLMESATDFAIYQLAKDEANPHLLKVKSVSPSIKDILGIPNPMKFETWFENIHPDDVGRIAEANKLAFKTFKFDEEYRAFNQSMGEWRWIHAISTGGAAKGGWNKFVNGILIDITERKQSEKALIESEEKHRRIFENLQDVYYEADMEGTILEVSPSIQKISQYARKELIGKSLYDIYTDPKERNELVNLILEKGKVEDYEIHLKDKGGTQHFCSINTLLIRDNQGRPARLIGSMRDISESKRVEEALLESEEKFRTLFDTAPIAIALTDIKTGEFVDINDKFCQITQYTKTELVGRTTTQLGFYSVDDRNRFVKELTNKGKVDGMTMDFKMRDGSIINALMFAGPIEIEREIFILTGFYDITEQKQLESRLQQSQKMESIGTLAGGIAHDFNNILFPIVGYTEMLLEDVPEDGPLRDKINEIYSGALRAKDLVKQILTFSRQDSIEIKLIKIQPIIKEALKLVRSTIPTSIEIKQYIKKDCGIIKAGPTQIHQVVMNLATNAYHAMEDSGGELKVGLKEIELGEQDVINPEMEPGSYACLTVADTGVGIDKKIIWLCSSLQ